MAYRLLADLVVLVHFAWIVFVILGAFWGRRHRWVRTVHLGALGYALLLETFGWYCPLTYLEVWLRARHVPATGYAGDFIPHYLEKLIYLDLPRPALIAGTLLVVAGNAWLYLHRRR